MARRIRAMPLFDLLRLSAVRTPLAIACMAGTETCDYGALRHRVELLTQAWRALGLRPGERIAYADWNTPRCLEAYFAAAAGGFIFVPLNTRLGAAELGRILADAQPALLCAEVSLTPLCEAAVALMLAAHLGTSVAAPRLLCLGGEHCAQEELIAHAPTFAGAHPVQPQDPAQIYYTSGTTGEPKGVVLTHANVEAHARAAAQELELSAADTWGHIAPMFHLADAWAVFAITLVGGRHVFVPRFEPAAVLRALVHDGITITNLVPTMLNSLVQQPGAAEMRFPALRRILSGGAPIAPALVQRIMDTFRTEYVNTYGMTETSPYLTLSLPTAEVLALSAAEQFHHRAMTGRPFRGIELRVVSDDGTPVSADGHAVGEIQVRGASVTPGYWRNAAATVAAFTADGFLRTGDLAVLHPTGYVNIVDRRKDVIITGGEKVYTTEVEAVLATHPALLEAAVFARPSEQWGEQVTAAVVLRPRAHVQAEELIAFCRAALSAWKVPREIWIVEALPRTGSGKISKQALRSAASAKAFQRE
ncbi:MAG: hypothetical protein EXS14_10065 [Planctomycetes bacterium]|nr:hypothetical protein [Planctomycetota bacterium]